MSVQNSGGQSIVLKDNCDIELKKNKMENIDVLTSIYFIVLYVFVYFKR